MADLFAVAGAKFYIGGVTETQSDDFAEADFTGETWVEVDGWETAGAYGDAAEIISTNLINRGRTVKQKGTRNAGQMTNQFAEIPDDPGQVDMKDAEATSDNFAFRVVFDDAPSGGTATTHYFVGLVTSWRTVGGGANTVRMREANIEINSNVVEVPAAGA